MDESYYGNKGLVYNIQRYSLHDGPGIRTVVFFKGCPLRCQWCANPESQKMGIETMGTEKIGRMASIDEILDVVSRDIVFYEESGGGMTLSGGEALMQPDFAEQLALEAKRMNINVAIETSAFQHWEALWRVIENVDIVLLDIKSMDSELHEKFVGAGNELILENAKRMSCMNKEIIVRIPIIPSFNDSWENLAETSMFCKKIGVNEIQLLPYHSFGISKYKKMGRQYKLEGLAPPSKDNLKRIALELEMNFGVKVSVV